MSNIMSQVKLHNKPSRNAFDLSRKNAFTAKVGELLPVACIEVLPGDNFEAKIQHFTRTMPLNTAAFTRVREYYDWFFVPTNLLWNKFNTFVTQMSKNNQHARSLVTNNHISDTHPYFTTSQVHNYIREFYGTNRNNIFGFNRGSLTVKLLNYLGYGDFTQSLTSDTSINPYRTNINYNPFPLLAYQKIYSDYYRDSQWEQAYAPAFNLDYISGQSNENNLDIGSLYTTYISNYSMFDLRYCNWKKDKFMGLLPSAQYGASASIDISPRFAYTIRSASSSGGNNQNVVVNPSGDLTNNYAPDTNQAAVWNIIGGTDNILGHFSILALRQAEALQKWKEITNSQQQDYKSQIEAHFGVSMSDAYSERCRFIDGLVSNLDISEVTNTNITGDNTADIAGKGVGVGNGKFNFKSDVHGYLMCIYHAVPLLDYSISGVNRMNSKTKVTDYAIPEFDAIGMVQVPTTELTNNVSSSKFTSQLLGYAPRYYDYKVSIDEVHGAFKTDLAHWVAPIGDTYINKFLENVTDTTSLNYIFFKVNPSFLNPIFAQNADSSVSSDQLLVNAHFDITAVRNLDRNGLPY